MASNRVQFDPRKAALTHAGLAQQLAAGHSDAGTPTVIAEFANAVACGLVYVGDQIDELVKQGESVDAEVVDPRPTFAELKPMIRQKATELLWRQRAIEAEHSEPWIDDVLAIAENLVNENGGVYVRAGG